MDKIKKKKNKEKHIKINIDNTTYPAISRNAKKLGWIITESIENNLLFWFDNNVTIQVCMELNPWQFINHIPGTYMISRKVDLYRNIEKMLKIFPEHYNFHPKSFIVPSQTLDLIQYMNSISLKKKKTFIIKPDCGAQGKGIFLIQNPLDIKDYFESSIAQQYLSPCLINGYKFDLRIYVLVSSINPLRIYIFKEGMARFCTEKYQKPKNDNLDKIFSHLTNYSLNKKNENFHQPSNEDDEGANKRTLTNIFEELLEKGVNIQQLQKSIDKIIVFTILSSISFLSHTVRSSFKANDDKSRCFEIMGFDILRDNKNKPWLLEVNHSPSFTCDSVFDKQLKDSVLTGTMKLININPNFKKIYQLNQKNQTFDRISGKISIDKNNSLFDPIIESNIALEVGWRQLFPNNPDKELNDLFNDIYLYCLNMPLNGSEDTTTSKNRREAIQNKIKKNNEEIKIIKNNFQKKNNTLNDKQLINIKTPRAVLLLREAKKVKLQSDNLREFKNKEIEQIYLTKNILPNVKKPQIVPKNIFLDL